MHYRLKVHEFLEAFIRAKLLDSHENIWSQARARAYN
jgi:hypothetical protein